MTDPVPLPPTDDADIISPISDQETDTQAISQLLDQILSKAHPLLAEGLYLAAVPHAYDVELFKALRARADDRDEKLVARLSQFSFIRPTGTGNGQPHYYVRSVEREILQQRWINTDRPAFIAAQQRALEYCRTHPDPDPFTQDQNRLYHLLMVDPDEGANQLVRAFRVYTGERRLAAADRLLAMAAEARTGLATLAAAQLADFDDLLHYLTARLAQLRGLWRENLEALQALREKPSLSPELVPYAARAYGFSLAKTGDYVGAIAQYEFALKTFRQLPESTAEQAFTMLALGDAYVDLAISARGARSVIPHRWSDERWSVVKDLLASPYYFPLIVYLSLYFGRRMWNPKSWGVLIGQDWIIARLFGAAAYQYRQADRILNAEGIRSERVQADEKLANLYLTMGDAAQAVPLYQTLLEEKEAPLGEYRRACVQLNLGQALLRLGASQPALEHFQTALPVVEAYDDAELRAQAFALLAEAKFKTGEHTEGLQLFDRAMRLYQKQGDVVGATEVAERLEDLAQVKSLAAEKREVASTTARALARRQYPVRFRHPTLVLFRSMVLLFSAIVIFVLPLLIVHVETGSVVLPEVKFRPSPMLSPDANFNPTLSQSVVLNLQPSSDTQVAIQLAAALLVMYLLSYTLVGIFVIARTQLQTVQDAQAESVRLDMDGLSVGRKTIRWRDVTWRLAADVRLVNRPLIDYSHFVVATPDTRTVVKGQTVRYSTLRDRLDLFLPRTAQRTELSFSLLRSKLGWVYLLSIAGLIAFMLIGALNARLLLDHLLGTPYNAADLYPYLYLGVFLPPFWWVVVQPLRIRAQTRPGNLLPWLVGGTGLLLMTIHLLAADRLFLIQFDIYLLLAAMILVGSAGWAVWTTRRPGAARQPYYPLNVRAPLGAFVVVVCLVAGVHLWRVIDAYNALLAGNARRDRGVEAQQQRQPERATQELEMALAHYDHVLALFPENGVAFRSRAAVKTHLGQYESAVEDNTDALEYSLGTDRVYSARALTYQAWGQALQRAGDAASAQEKFAAELTDFDEAIEQRPDDPNYYTWRGLTYHALGRLPEALQDYQVALAYQPNNAQALMGQGWVYFADGHTLGLQANRTADEAAKADLQTRSLEKFKQALASFQAAVKIEESPEIWLAIGYAHYRLKEYAVTLSDLERAVALAPDDPILLISRGTAHWQLAEGGRCGNAQVDAAGQAEAARQLSLAIDDFNRALALHPTDHFTYRTRAQVEFLLRNCPGYDLETQLKAAIASYGQAITYAPNNDGYWQFRARLGYVLGQSIFRDGLGRQEEARHVLQQAIDDIHNAYALNPDSRDNQNWQTFIEEGWGRYHLQRGWDFYQAGEYDQALADSKKAAGLLVHLPAPAFNAGLITLARQDQRQAVVWYTTGLERATALEDPQARVSALQEALGDLNALLEARPALRPLARPILDSLRAGLDAR